MFNFTNLTAMQKGRVDKHLNIKIRYDGVITTNGDIYKEAVNKKITSDSKGRQGYGLILKDGSVLDVPKMIYEAFGAW